MTISREEAGAIAEEAACKAVKQVMKEIGVDIRHPLDMQADFQHLRRHRELAGNIGGWVIRTLVLAVISGVVATLWLGLKAKLSGG